MEEVNERMLEAAKRLIECKGYEIVDAKGFFDIVATDDCGVYFIVAIRATDGWGIEPGISSETLERKAAEWLTANDCTGRPFRLDAVGVLPISEDVTMLRLFANFLGIADNGGFIRC